MVNIITVKVLLEREPRTYCDISSSYGKIAFIMASLDIFVNFRRNISLGKTERNSDKYEYDFAEIACDSLVESAGTIYMLQACKQGNFL